MNTNILVCIDPGHAESTAGKRSFDGTLREYEFNRDISRRQKYHLERHGIHTMFSCDIDTPIDISLDERCKNANAAKADIFISNHGNGFHKESAHGWEIFICKGSTEGRKLAEAIRSESIPSLGLTDRGIKTNSLYVTKHTDMPAVLVEHGFYTNNFECALMKTAEFREMCAVADVKGILKYFGMKWIEEETEEIDVEKLAELEAHIKELKEQHKVYDKIDADMPEWIRNITAWALATGIIQGDGNGLAMTAQKAETLVMLKNALKL